MKQPTFLFSSLDPLPDLFFSGYCFIGTDFIYGGGGAKLFLYQSGSEWTVSNSFVRLVSFLRDRRQPVSIDHAQLASWFVKGAFGEQLCSFATAVREIRVVPSCCYLRITPSGYC